MLNRRNFLKHSILLPILTGSGLTILTTPVYSSNHSWDKTLVLLELKGGNDGLNTIVPFNQKIYYNMRPTLAVPKDKVIKISKNLGFNPALAELIPLWKRNEMAIVQGVGYPNPNLSHFRGINIWNTASNSETFIDNGWISRLLQETKPDDSYAADGINLGKNSAGALIGKNSRLITLATKPEKILRQASRIVPGKAQNTNNVIDHILKQRQDLRGAANNIIEKKIERVNLDGKFGNSKLAAQFETAARLLIASVKVPVLKLTIDKYDTHAEQEPLHSELLQDVAKNINSFSEVMKSHDLWNRVTVMTYSEFGRRPAENNSGGTDHGTAAPQFLFGGRVKGGFYGKDPKLDELDNENLKHNIHFREIYASVARDWWKLKAEFIEEKSLNLFF